jgi:hypothetical protein
MSDSLPPHSPEDIPRRQPEALGGADAVEKTTYVTGSGADPERMRGEGVPAAKGAGRTPNATTAILIFLAVGALLVYLFGWGR